MYWGWQVDSGLVYNAIQTPDGTVLQSRHTHDYQEYRDKVSGEDYIIDGGLSYIGCSVNKVPAKSLHLYEEDSIEEIREKWSWGSYGPKGDQPLRYILLKDMEKDHMEAICKTCTIRWVDLFDRELKYRGMSGGIQEK